MNFGTSINNVEMMPMDFQIAKQAWGSGLLVRVPMERISYQQMITGGLAKSKNIIKNLSA